LVESDYSGTYQPNAAFRAQAGLPGRQIRTVAEIADGRHGDAVRHLYRAPAGSIRRDARQVG